MNIRVAKTAGFCFGVSRADKLIRQLLAEGKRVCTWGPLIHNPGYISALKEQGVVIAENIADIPPGATLVIRTHGIPASLRQELEATGFEIADATCPFVGKIQTIVDRETADGTAAVIAGDPDHPEVIGIRSYCHGDSFVCRNCSELEQVFAEHPDFSDRKLIMVSQTTFSLEEFKKYIFFTKKVCTNLKIFDTICFATSERQTEAAALAKESDAMIVVGGKNSSNTQKLFSVCAEYCPTYFVQSAGEIDRSLFSECCNVGITAGASTPDSVIKEVRNTMSEEENIVETTETAVTEEPAVVAAEPEAPAAEPVEAVAETAAPEAAAPEKDFSEMLEEDLKTSMSSDPKVVGIVMSIQPNEIQVDIGRKQTGYVPIEEYSADPNADPAKELQVGDKLNLIIMKTNDNEGTVMCSKRLYDAKRFWEEIESAFETKEILTAKVTEVLAKGVIAFHKGTRIFIPASQSGVPRSGSLEVLKDQDVELRIIDIDSYKRRAVGSIKSVVDERRAAASEEFWANAFVGKVMNGRVKSLTSFAAFVDLGGVDGMIHRSEISWKRIKQPSDVLSVGDEVEVTIKSLDPEKKKVGLSYRKIEDNPWEILRRDYPVGTVCEVKIVGLTTFGAFAQIFPGMDGLIHISQISDRRIGQPSDILSVGDVVTAKIIEIDFEKKRISLSIRALLDTKPATEKKEPEEVADDSAPIPIEEFVVAETEEDGE